MVLLRPPRRLEARGHWPLGALAALLGVACATSTPPPPPAAGPAPRGAPAELAVLEPPALRLPTTVHPVREGLALRLLPEDATFSGTATLDLAFEEAVQHFWLHAQGLSVDEARLTAGPASLPVTVTPSGDDLLLVRLGVPFGPGEARLVLRYRGPIDAQRSRGIYRVAEGATPYLYTFFEPVDARRAFPCFDEPSFKIPWTLSLTVPAQDVAFANTAAVSTTEAGPGL